MTRMTRAKAFKMFRDYVKNRGIKFTEYLENGEVSLLMAYESSNAPDKILEMSASFFETCMEVRCYYSENAATWIKERAGDLTDMYRLLNFINARLWPRADDYAGGTLRHLYTPRFYITEDLNYDLTSTIVVNYSHFEPLTTLGFCTAKMPQIMDELALPIFFLLLKRITVEEAIFSVKKDILKEDA